MAKTVWQQIEDYLIRQDFQENAVTEQMADETVSKEIEEMEAFGAITTNVINKNAIGKQSDVFDQIKKLYKACKKEKIEELLATDPQYEVTDTNGTLTSLKVIEMDPDGHCLYRAVAFQVYGDPDMYQQVRNKVADYVLKNKDKPFDDSGKTYKSIAVPTTGQEPNLTEDQRFDNYVNGVRGNAWGDDLELAIVNKIYKPLGIEVERYEVKSENGALSIKQHEKAKGTNVIRLLYINGDHYEALVPKTLKVTENRRKKPTCAPLLRWRFKDVLKDLKEKAIRKINAVQDTFEKWITNAFSQDNQNKTAKFKNLTTEVEGRLKNHKYYKGLDKVDFSSEEMQYHLQLQMRWSMVDLMQEKKMLKNTTKENIENKVNKDIEWEADGKLKRKSSRHL